METHRLIKTYFFYPLLIGLVLFTTLHWFDSQIRNLEESLIFGLKFATGFSIVVGLTNVFGIKFIRPILDKKFTNHKRLDALTKFGFVLSRENNIYSGNIQAYRTEFYYAYEEMDILKSRYYIVVIFEQISKEKHKTLKPWKLFDNTSIGANYMVGYHEFMLFPPKTSDLLSDVNAFCSYLKRNNIKTEETVITSAL